MSKPHIEHEEPVQDGLSRTLKDLFAGAVGGVAQVLSLLRQFSTQTEPHFLGTHWTTFRHRQGKLCLYEMHVRHTLTSYLYLCRSSYHSQLRYGALFFFTFVIHGSHHEI